MINVMGHDLWRAGKKVGYVSGDYIYSHEGKKLGYASGNHIFDVTGRKLGYLEGDFIYDITGTQKMRIEDNRQHVEGGELSDLMRAAVRFLLGD